MTVTKQLPSKSILKQSGKIFHYIDSYQSEFIDKRKNISPSDIGRSFFTSIPEWVSKLFTIRNKIVGLFGLKTSGNQIKTQIQLENFKFEPGERFKLFKVFTKTDDELVFGEDDKHLNFRISLLLDHNQTDKKTLAITTAVEFNNSFGRHYFLIVKPFHKLIVALILNRVKKKLEK